MKSEGRIEQEKAIMNKIQSIFDNAELIKEFEINISGGVGDATEIKNGIQVSGRKTSIPLRKN